MQGFILSTPTGYNAHEDEDASGILSAHFLQTMTMASRSNPSLCN
jgi:hypothetical protein